MTEERVQRKLAAILAADVVGFSRMMEKDEEGTLTRLRALRRDLFEPIVREHGGRVFKTTGDGALVEFKSASDAVRSAVGIQKAIGERNNGVEDDARIELRIGVSLGDVMIQGSDLFGNGVNVAARMEALAAPGGICISGNVQEHVKGDHEIRLDDLGGHRVKGIESPVRVYRVDIGSHEMADPSSTFPESLQVRFCETSDRVRIAYATLGQGPTVVSVSNWLTHLELDALIPVRRALAERLVPNFRFVRFDARGNGLSDWQVDDISLEASIRDLVAVIEDLNVERFALIGQSQGAAIAAAYAARNPDRVTHLVLYGGYARGRRMRGSAGQIAESDAFVTMIREGWGKNIDAYVRMFGTFFMPDANAEQLAGFTNLQRAATPPENAARIQLAIDSIDISDELPNIAAPALVFHAREDARSPFEEGRRMAAAIPGARFVPLESRNHALLPGEPAIERYLSEVESFLRS